MITVNIPDHEDDFPIYWKNFIAYHKKDYAERHPYALHNLEYIYELEYDKKIFLLNKYNGVFSRKVMEYQEHNQNYTFYHGSKLVFENQADFSLFMLTFS